MDIALLAEGWPGEPALNAYFAAIEATMAWSACAEDDGVWALPVGDGGPHTTDSWLGDREDIAPGVVAARRGAELWLAPASGDARWRPAALAVALARLAEHGERRVVVPLGDDDPEGDAGDVWTVAWPGGLAAARAALAGLELVALTGSDRPLLGFRGMNAARADAAPGNAAVAAAAQRAEELWAARASEVDALAPRRGLLGASRLADAPGAGAAGGLAFALAALGAALRPGALALADAAGLGEAMGDADLVVAVVPELTPRTLDHGTPMPASAAAAAKGVPAVVLASAVKVGKRDLMAAGISGAHEAAPGPAGLADGIRRVAQTWSR